ncbi:hypothetical protein [Vreelandella salicampi]|uniref:Asparagine synthetase domain-containing protein n=1 Tax=Vreelandella salicampi TaxID=1449798 RepID=A0A7Z0RUA4_9GAMM|nr:hypothetical protein [Halomonas salicampi]NYS60323.1 hypothetical protein [Halomonas salicampi]
MFKSYLNQKDFLITNDWRAEKPEKNLENKYIIYGHCFTDDGILKNRYISKTEFDYIKRNHWKLSGLFVCIGLQDGIIDVLIDPLVQYPVFYVEQNGIFALSNKLSNLSKLYYDKYNIDYLFDSLIYEAPLRGMTPVKSVKMLQFDNLQIGSQFQNSRPGLTIHKTNILSRKDLDYSEALETLADNIKKRAKIISESFEYIECQLSGGLDCRIVAAAFKNYDNIFYYSFGLDSQDRLCFEDLADKFGLRKTSKIRFFGSGIRNAAYRIKMIDDLNGIKLHTYGGYMNYDEPIDIKGCKLSGYFGEYIGHKLPSAYISPEDGSIIKFPHIDALPERAYKVANEYSMPFWTYNLECGRYKTSKRAVNQLFYLNNRGPSHFGMHSAADNVHDSSFNILYDPVAITVSEQSPYSDLENKEGATCVDLICSIAGLDFGLFPYEGRRIPRYREFDWVPEINCFDGYSFSARKVEQIQREHSIAPDLSHWDALGDSDKTSTSAEILNNKLFDTFFRDFPELAYLRNLQFTWPYRQHQEILCNFLLADYFYSGAWSHT